MAVTKRLLSASSGGRGILVTGVAATGTLLHTSVSGTSDLDEVWVYAVNTATANRKLTVEHGTTSSPRGQVEFTVPAEDGLYLVVPGLLVNNQNTVRAFATAASQVVVHGYVHRITA